MPDNYYQFINAGIIPDCRGLTVTANTFLSGYTQIDDDILINNAFVSYANGFFGFANISDVYFESNSVVFESYTQFSSGKNVAFFSNVVDFVGNAVIFDTYVDLGNVVDISIAGGNNGQVLTTDGNGNLSWSNISGNAVTTEIYYVDYDVPIDGTPVYANSTANRTVPLIYVGTDPGANYKWPYYQNTSTTANGYLANSTAAWAPDNASILSGNAAANTITGDWYRLNEVGNFNSNVASNTILSQTITIHSFGNVANIAYQVVPFVGYASNDNVYLTTSRISTCYTNNSQPDTSVVTITDTYRPDLYNLPGTGNFTLAGYYIRNITANSELTVYACSLRLELNT